MEPTNTIDLDILGPLTKECVNYLANKTAEVCQKNSLWYLLSVRAREDFGWDHPKLLPYIKKGLMPAEQVRISAVCPGDEEEKFCEFLSSSEWLCGIFCSGYILKHKHVSLHMGYVNIHSDPLGIYKSGKETWNDAPSPLKEIFDILDTASLEGKDVNVKNLGGTTYSVDDINSPKKEVRLSAVFTERDVEINISCGSYIHDSFFGKVIVDDDFKFEHLILLASYNFEDQVFEFVKLFLETNNYLVREIVNEDEEDYQVNYFFGNEMAAKVNELTYEQITKLLSFADSFDIKPLITALIYIAKDKHANKGTPRVLAEILKEIRGKRLPPPEMLAK